MSMFRFCCPVCGEPLWDMGRSLRCARGHSFDRARRGYVNLLMSGTSSGKRHGDDRLMVAARRHFLDAGHYRPLLECIAGLAAELSPEGALLDAGCGDGYYTAAVAAVLAGRAEAAVGIDISRDALAEAHRRDGSLMLAAAGANRLPAADGSCGTVLSIFAPCFPGEAARVLNGAGLLLRAVPLRRHLYGLKAAVYDRPYENPEPEPELPGFELVARRRLEYMLHLDSGAEIRDLFMMTPYYYKTSAADQAKLSACRTLETEAAFGVFAYKKRG